VSQLNSQEGKKKKTVILTHDLRSLFMWYMWRVEDVDITVMTA
jgi:hypothetical protein